MKIAKKINTLFGVLAVLLTVGCGKEDPAPKINQVPQVNYQLLQDSVSGNEPNKYFYNDLGQVVRIERKNYYETLEYDIRGRLVRNNFNYYATTQPSRYNLFQYNAVGQVIKVSEYADVSTGSFQADGYTTFKYDMNGNLIERSLFYNSDPSNRSVYTHRPDGSVVEKFYNDFFGDGNLSLTQIWEYQFDTKKNPYAIIQNGRSISSAATFGQIFSSPHNIISEKEYGPEYTYLKSEVNVSYQYNLDGYPVKAHYNFNGTMLEGVFNYNYR